MRDAMLQDQVIKYDYLYSGPGALTMGSE